MFLLNTERIYLYEGNESIYLDVYAINDTRLSPRDAVLIIPGGGYSNVALDIDGEKGALAYVSRGVNAFVLNYIEKRENDSFPVHLERAALAMAYIKNNAEKYNVNPERVFALGFSAGGHLAATLATKYSFAEERLSLPENIARPKGIILAYSVISAYTPTHNATFVNLLKKPFKEITKEERNYHSADMHVTPDTPPAFMWHTSEDASVTPHGSLKMALAYANAGVPFALHIYPYGPHGMALASEFSSPRGCETRTQPLASGWLDDSIEWMKTIL